MFRYIDFYLAFNSVITLYSRSTGIFAESY